MRPPLGAPGSPVVLVYASEGARQSRAGGDRGETSAGSRSILPRVRPRRAPLKRSCKLFTLGKNVAAIFAQIFALWWFTMEAKTLLNPRQLLTPEQAARRLAIKPATLAVWRCTKRYPLRFIRVGRSVRYDPRDIEKFLERNTESGQ